MTIPILKVYLKRLTNLSSRNRSLLLGSLPAEQFLDLHELDFLDNFASFELIRQLIAQKNTVKLCDVTDPRLAKINEVSKKLRKIARTQTFIEEERGAQDLYVGWPFVRGKLMDGTLIHGPLLFFAVTLEATEKHWHLRRRDEPTTINRSFLLAYAHFNQIALPEELLETNLDDLNRDALNFRTELYELLRDSPLKINFNQDLFQEKLQPFDVLKAADLELLERNGELKLYSEAVLGIFPQAGSYLAPDYEALIKRYELGNVNFELGKRSPPNELGIIKEENTFTAFEQDASQEEALQRVKAGESLVVQGPPGTGKSQLIANLMADFAARGKRVLLVCQKRVALDVVQQRLQSVGMTPFVALIHDFKNDRAALYQQLAAQIDQVETNQKQNEGLDAIFLERKFRQSSRVIEQTAAELAEFKTTLFDESDCGISPKELYLSSHPNAPQIDLGADFRAFKFDDHLAHFLQRLRQYEAYFLRLPSEHLWTQRVSFAGFGTKELRETEQQINEILAWVLNFAKQTNELTGQALTLPDSARIWTQKEQVKQLRETLENSNQWRLVQHLLFAEKKVLFPIKLLNELAIPASELLKNGIETTLNEEELEVALATLQNIQQKRNSAIGNLFWKTFSAQRKWLDNLAQNNNLTSSIADTEVLKNRIENKIAFAKTWKKLLVLFVMPLVKDDFDKRYTKENFDKIINDYNKAVKAAQLFGKLDWQFQKNMLAFQLPSFQKNVDSLLDLCWQTEEKQVAWKRYLSDYQINELAQNPELQNGYKSLLRQDFDLLVEADALKAGFSEIEWAAVQQLMASSTGQGWEVVFQNALRLAWLEHLENKYPILRAVSSLKIRQLEENLQENVLQKQDLSREILLLKLREQTYQDLAFNRLQNRVTYRDLQHQVTKKRKIWPVRKLLETHGDDVFRLVPCWLASPESVSAMFPLVEGLFDLVIFDEASQCYAEYGLPALFRGKQAIVAGDSKQLTPTDLYRVRYEGENEEENPELEVKSLLGLATQYFPQTQLQGHYRSRSLALIAFSNQHFYHNKLQLLPHFWAINRQEPALQYVKVEGVWQHNTNQIEAQKVIELVRQLTENEPKKSIGVVTFNQPQQQLIEQLMDNEKSSFSSETAGWTVKNIENVQGDERDIIIFSVGYAPDANGKLRAQFGSLNASGGENRLNVAVTRARERVYVVTSIWPQQLQVADTTHEGPKLLKKYLEYALKVSEGRFQPQPPISAGYRNEWLLKKKMKHHDPDFSLKEELPFADLTLKQGERYESLILTDDDLFFQSRSAKEAHAYWPLQLRAKGWSFERVWSREWWRGLRD